jgi:hypothetical protein
MDPRPVQRLVDMQWAGHQAARLLGGRARISVSAPTGDEPDVTVTITYVDPDGTGRDRAEQGMDLLLGSVRAEQEGSSGSSAPGLR